MNRKKWSNEEKVTIVLEVIKGAKLSSSIYHYKSKGEREQRAHDIDLVPTNHEVHQGRKSLSK